MKILLVHNHYQVAGGEDTVVCAEKSMLESHGHSVAMLEVSNEEIGGAIGKAAVAARSVYSLAGKRLARQALDRFRPDVVHVHNFFPLLSPAIYDACREAGVPVVQTLHNYRLLCPNALFFRDGHVCEDCLNKFVPWPGVLHACYRGSRVATVPVAAMLSVHHALQTWTSKVDVYIALTKFCRDKFVEGGLPEDKVAVKPNFVHPAPQPGSGRGGYALFVGRLSPEKGIETLLAAWEKLSTKIPLKIVGDGPVRDRVTAAIESHPGVEWLGRLPRERVTGLMQDARLLVFPSIWYETFGMSIVEAFAVGTPVLASDLGVMASLVEHGRTGLRFRAGDPADLVRQVQWVLDHPMEFDRMRTEARREFESKYTAERNHEMLMKIYHMVIHHTPVPADLK